MNVIKGLMKKLLHTSDEGVKKTVPDQDTQASNNQESVNNVEKTLHDVENFVDYVVRSLVDNPHDVTVTVRKKENEDTLMISCNKDDIGKIIGKRGKIITAIRSLVRGVGNRINKNITVEVIE